VDQCETIGDDAIEEVIINCPYLQELYLGSTHITDNSLNLIATKLILLTHLYIPGCEYITEIGVNKVVHECKTLQHIDIADCYNVVGTFGRSRLRSSLNIRGRFEFEFEFFRDEDQWEDVDDEEDEEEEDLLDGDRPPAYSLF
jgi:hypothetical protein